MDRCGMLTKAPVSAAFAKLCLDQGSARVHGTLSGAVECVDIKRGPRRKTVYWACRGLPKCEVRHLGAPDA